MLPYFNGKLTFPGVIDINVHQLIAGRQCIFLI
ncbi:Uncharacterised protein [Klebsiella pneumoniae]|nr:Uncharacterised protein [Klebsiella pneumoniae]